MCFSIFQIYFELGDIEGSETAESYVSNLSLIKRFRCYDFSGLCLSTIYY